MKHFAIGILLLFSGLANSGEHLEHDSRLIGSWSFSGEKCSGVLTFQTSGEFNVMINDSSRKGTFKIIPFVEDEIITYYDGDTYQRYCTPEKCQTVVMTAVEFVDSECQNNTSVNLIEVNHFYFSNDDQLNFDLERDNIKFIRM